MTGKYLSLERSLSTSKEGDYSGFICNIYSSHSIYSILVHQKITDDLTLLRSKTPAFADVSESNGAIWAKFDHTDEGAGIFMYLYKIVKLTY